MSSEVAATSGRERARRWSTGVVALVAVVGALLIVRSDPAEGGGERIVSRHLARNFLPYLGVAPFADVRDLRELSRPADGIREWFAAREAAYQTLAVGPDEATLVVWERGGTGSPPFERGTALGHGCASLHRDGATVRSTVVECPDGLPAAPDPLSAFAPDPG